MPYYDLKIVTLGAHPSRPPIPAPSLPPSLPPPFSPPFLPAPRPGMARMAHMARMTGWRSAPAEMPAGALRVCWGVLRGG